jgi:hypothetical protein
MCSHVPPPDSSTSATSATSTINFPRYCRLTPFPHLHLFIVAIDRSISPSSSPVSPFPNPHQSQLSRPNGSLNRSEADATIARPLELSPSKCHPTYLFASSRARSLMFRWTQSLHIVIIGLFSICLLNLSHLRPPFAPYLSNFYLACRHQTSRFRLRPSRSLSRFDIPFIFAISYDYRPLFPLRRRAVCRRQETSFASLVIPHLSDK